LGEITGGGGCEALAPHTVTLDPFGSPCRFLGLEKLIQVKHTTGRPRDLEAILLYKSKSASNTIVTNAARESQNSHS
jgi:hypothetical protein